MYNVCILWHVATKINHALGGRGGGVLEGFLSRLRY